jgi:hypothetical protein
MKDAIWPTQAVCPDRFADIVGGDSDHFTAAIATGLFPAKPQ